MDVKFYVINCAAAIPVCSYNNVVRQFDQILLCPVDSGTVCLKCQQIYYNIQSFVQPFIRYDNNGNRSRHLNTCFT
jgi:hypothetical protein